MNVEQILRAKGTAVTTVSPHTPVDEAAKKLAMRKIGAVVVVDSGGAVVGILSERDIIRGLATQGANLLQSPVSSLMTRQVVQCGLGDSIDRLMATMTENRFRHLPVSQHGRLVGIVSIGDVVKYHVAEVTEEASHMREYINHGGEMHLA